MVNTRRSMILTSSTIENTHVGIKRKSDVIKIAHKAVLKARTNIQKHSDDISRKTRLDSKKYSKVFPPNASLFEDTNSSQDIKYENQFNDLYLELRCGFNLILYGPGSKIKTIKSLVVFLKTRHVQVLKIEGHLPNIKTKKISETVDTLFSSKSPNKVLIVTSIDQIWSRSFKKFESINEIFKRCVNANIGIIVTVDSINSSLLWDTTNRSHLKWVYHSYPTYDNYSEELSNRELFFSRNSNEQTVESLSHVIFALPEKAQIIFKFIAETHVRFLENGQKPLIEFDFLYNACRNEFMVSNEQTLRAVLVELSDHKIISSSSKGTNFREFQIIYSKEIIQMFLNSKFLAVKSFTQSYN
uniref:Origin recognition complex subunit 2 n=1 Tax=Myxobolus squamalis TaxID=59785 RepID=A0A6B2G2B9_MYXSQ